MDHLAEESDDRLVELARVEGTRDTRPFETLVRRHQGFVAANCRAITRSPNDAEDLAQEVFVKAFFGLRRFEKRAEFRTWLRRIKVNHCLNFLRRTRGAVLVDLEDVPPDATPSMWSRSNPHDELQADVDRDLIVSVLDAMSDTLRITLMLRDADGLSYEEIADALGIGLSAVKMRVKRAREEFRRRFAAASAVIPTDSRAQTESP